MKSWKLSLMILCGALAAQAQVIRPLEEVKWPESDHDAKFYTVKHYRHGLCFFPKVRYDHVEYEPSDRLSFDKYHTADVIYHWMKVYAGRYPDLIDLYEVARSYEGRPIIQMTLTNKRTGRAADKPAAYFEGGRHSSEVLTCESILWLMRHLTENYGKEPQITALLDKNTIYLRPVNNPDGHNLFMHTAQSNRSSTKPFDQDGDGLLDEDPYEDLNGDGHISMMRIADKENGDYILHPDDPSGRLMKKVARGKGDYTRAFREGIDNDADGKFNEDGIGGYDLHRNYPANWRPLVEETGRGWNQIRPGEYPLSEPETRSVVMFLLANPHVSIANSMDTNLHMHLRGPSTAFDEDIFPEDRKWYKHLDSVALSITDYNVSRDNSDGTWRFGTSRDFGYWSYGAIWYGDELYDGGKAPKDYDGDGYITESDRLIWDDTENDGQGFIRWTPYKHPQLGDIEIGGWNLKFMLTNPPSKFMEPWAKKQALWNIALAGHLPELQWGDVEVVKLPKKADTDYTDYEVSVSYKNVGGLPTALRQADLVKIVRPDQVRVLLPGDAVTGGNPKAKILPGKKQERGTPASTLHETIRNTGYAQPGETLGTTVTIRVFGDNVIEGKVFVQTTRAGILPEKTFTLSPSLKEGESRVVVENYTLNSIYEYVTITVDPERWYLTHVCKNYRVSRDYVPPSVSAVKNSKRELDSRVVPHYNAMYDAAEADGVTLIAQSGYRTVEWQENYFNSKVRRHMLDDGMSEDAAILYTTMGSAYPGASEHNLGFAMDFRAADQTRVGIHFDKTDQFAWLTAHAADYGFILRYPSDKKVITGTNYEPWHWRYVGVEDAKKIKARGMCLEEYLGRRVLRPDDAKKLKAKGISVEQYLLDQGY